MAAITFDRYGTRQPTPRRQLVTVGELEELYGPDAKVEVSSTGRRGRQVVEDDGAEYGGAEYSVAPRRRFNPWYVAVVAVMLAAGIILVYGLHRTGQLTIPSRLGIGGRSLGPSEDVPAQSDWQPMIVMTRVPSEHMTLPAQPPLQSTTPEGTTPADALLPLAPLAASPPVTAPPRVAAPPRAIAKRPAYGSAPGGSETRTSAEIASDQAATEETLRREAAKAREQSERPSERAPVPQKEDYPPGYVEAESPAKP